MPKRRKSSNSHDSQTPAGIFSPSALPLSVLAGVGLIIVAVSLAYLHSINGGFVLDDDLLLTRNPLIKAPDGLYRFWCTTEAAEYYPVSNSTLWIEWRLWGMNSTGYHVTNLSLHIAAAMLIWVILRKLSIPGAFFAALIFAVHPVNVESVAWIAQRKSMMAMLFFLLSIQWYLKYFSSTCLDNTQQGRYAPRADPAHGVCGVHANRWYWLSLGAFVLAMLGKGSVAVLPVLLLGLVWWLRHLTMRDLVRTAPFFVIAAVLTGVNVWFQTHGSGVSVRSAGFIERLLGAGGVVWFYLFKAIVPINLAFIYPQWHIEAGNPLWWLPLAAALAVTAVLWRYRNNWGRPFLFAWGFFCVALVPVMGFTDVGFMQASLVADRYQHIALIGVIALAAAGWSVWHQLARGTAHRAATVVAVTAIGVLAFLTWQQSGLYRDAVVLYQDTLEKNPECYQAHYNLGNALRAAGQAQQAIEHYEQTLRLNPDYVEAHNNLGVELAKAGRQQEAIEHFHQALKLKPNLPGTYNNLGMAMAITGRQQEAIEYFEKALRLKADYFGARCNLGNALVKAGRQNEAIEHYKRALALRPDDTQVYGSLMTAYIQTNQPDMAIATARRILELARSQGQTALAKEIEDWLKAYRAGQSQ